MRKAFVQTDTSSQLGQVTKLMPAALFMATAMVKSILQSVKHFLQVFTLIHSFPAGKAGTIFHALLQRWTQLGAGMQTHVDVAFNHQASIQISKFGLKCGPIETRLCQFFDQPKTVKRYRNPRKA